jgi:phage recombination protein Bet
MNDIKTTNESRDLIAVMKSSLYPSNKLESIALVLEYCRAAGLDPLQKPVHIVPMWDSVKSEMRDVIMPGIGLYRIQASRSGCAGITEPEFGPDFTEIIAEKSITYPIFCKVTVKRRLVTGEVVEFTAKEFWKENYAIKGGKDKSQEPNAMWTKRPYGQIAKCAEAQALRKAFPEIGSQPTAEEMEGKIIDINSIHDSRNRTIEKIDCAEEKAAFDKITDASKLGDAWKSCVARMQAYNDIDHFEELRNHVAELGAKLKGASDGK